MFKAEFCSRSSYWSNWGEAVPDEHLDVTGRDTVFRISLRSLS